MGSTIIAFTIGFIVALFALVLVGIAVSREDDEFGAS